MSRSSARRSGPTLDLDLTRRSAAGLRLPRSRRQTGRVSRCLRRTGVVLCGLLCGLAPSAEATFPGANGRIAYVRERLVCVRDDDPATSCLTRVRNAFSIRPDGSGRRLLARAAEEPVFSPDGRRLAFQTNFGDPFNFDKVVIASLRSGRQRRLTASEDDDDENDPAWSPSGRRLVFQHDLFLTTVRRDGSGMDRLWRGQDPDWSVRGRIAFTRGYLIATFRPGDRRFRHLRDGTTPSWSPDGRWIAFVRELPHERTGIAVMRADGSGLRMLTTGPEHHSPAWSPDGREIAYIRRQPLRRREYIIVMRGDGSAHRVIRTVRDARVSDGLEDVDWQARPRSR